MPSPLHHILSTYPSIKKEFDLTAERFKDFVNARGQEIFRLWFGKLLKKITPHKQEGLDKIDIKVIRWTLIRLRKRNFEIGDELFAAGNAIFLDLYGQELALARKKEASERRQMTPIGDLVRRM